MQDDPLSHSLDLTPHTVTMNVGARLAKLVQTFVTHDDRAINVLHEIHCHERTDRIGFYRTCMQYGDKRTSYIWNIDLMLDMRDTWREHVKTQVHKMIKEITE